MTPSVKYCPLNNSSIGFALRGEGGIGREEGRQGVRIEGSREGERGRMEGSREGEGGREDGGRGEVGTNHVAVSSIRRSGGALLLQELCLTALFQG